TEVCEDDSRVFVLFVCDAFLSGVIGMHLFFINYNTYEAKVKVQSNICKNLFKPTLFIEHNIKISFV
ncbi:hypothetical protein, partial [Ruminococcus sp.]|uniref:hypothetical protein n=1 Tax=Ruminococcus sp. TaxID=41978 RepID=UPI003FD7EF4B